jgi:hypothetical protein
VTRAEKINLTVAAVVTAVLPNGNMVIQGSQEVRTNNELRQLTVSGIVRPEDISAANTINHTQIAEARISYGGRGDVSRVQKTPVGQSLVEKFSPFEPCNSVLIGRRNPPPPRTRQLLPRSRVFPAKEARHVSPILDLDLHRHAGNEPG